jgi:hypothetical protein
MTRIEFWEPAGETEVPGKGTFRDKFAPGAFANAAGKRVPFRSRPGGRQLGWVTVVSVVVDEDGYGATWTVDAEFPAAHQDRHALLRHMTGVTPGARMSFAFRPDDLGSAAWNPLAARPPVVRWRDPRE